MTIHPCSRRNEQVILRRRGGKEKEERKKRKRKNFLLTLLFPLDPHPNGRIMRLQQELRRPCKKGKRKRRKEKKKEKKGGEQVVHLGVLGSPLKKPPMP